MARIVNLFIILCIASEVSLAVKKEKRQCSVSKSSSNCTCGVFLSNQLLKGIPNTEENPIITIEMEEDVTCGPMGTTQCSRKCVQELVKYLPTSSSLICGIVDREVFKEKAHLLINIGNQGWVKSKAASAPKEICCKNSVDYKCPPA